VKAKVIGILVGVILTSSVAVAVATPGGGSHGHETDVGPPARVAAVNPAGHCVMLPANSDIISHPEKHPGWHVIGGQCP
jgi:hypothetical protein